MKNTVPQSNKLSEFHLISGFEGGYRNREDKTILPAGILVEGSQNVLTNTYKRIGIRKGYTLDGAASTLIAGIISSYDYQMANGYTRHLRVGFLTSAGNDGKIQYRYVDSTGAVTWRDLVTSLTTATIRFTNYWDTTKTQSRLLAVKGDAYIYEWTGGITTFASCTANTITKQGATYWAEEGFDTTGSVVINGTTYTYSGGSGSTTLTGVAPNPTGAGIVVGDIIHQAVTSTANGAMSLPLAKNDLISTLRNQVWVGDSASNSVYVSKQNDYKSYAFSTPRIVGEGMELYLDAPPTAFMPQEDSMYISCGKDFWYQSSTQLSSDLSAEALNINRLKTAPNQAAISQEAVTKDKNNIVYITFEPTLSTIGRVQAILGTPQATDISYPIINDFNSFDFTDACVQYHKNFLYVAVPREQKVLIYNQTNPQNPYWEAPQLMPIGRFSIIDGELYGHSYLTSETYKMFDGYNDNGSAIQAIASFSFMNLGNRARSKGFAEWYVEGYIASNTTLTFGLQYDIDGCATVKEYDLDGTSKFVCTLSDSASLGKESLGKNPLGGTILNSFSTPTLPPKFRWIKTMPIEPYFYEVQPSFSSDGVDQQWEILATGPQITNASDLNVDIKD